MRAGDIVGQWVLERRLDERATVWLARHQARPLLAAVKALKAPLPPAVAALEHPHIVAISEVIGDRLIMELLPGEPLARRHRHDPLSADEARSVLRQVCSALEAAHAAGVTHGRLDAQQIFVTERDDGELFATVTDFGGTGTPDDDVKAAAALLERLLPGTKVQGATLHDVLAALSPAPAPPPPAPAAPPTRSRVPLAAAAPIAAVLAVLGAWAMWPAAASAPVAPRPAPVTLTIRTEPPGAVVTRADTGEKLGMTPLSRALPRGSTAMPLKISHDGYADVERSASTATDTVIDLMLPPAH